MRTTDFLSHRLGPENGPGGAQGHSLLGRLPLEQGFAEQLVELMLILRGVHHSVCQVLQAQPPAWIGEGGGVGLQGSVVNWGRGWGKTGQCRARGTKGPAVTRTNPLALKTTPRQRLLRDGHGSILKPHPSWLPWDPRFPACGP